MYSKGLNRVWLDHPVYGQETVGEYLKRYKVSLDSESRAILYYGKLKSENILELKAGTYLEKKPEYARYFASLNQKGDVEVLELHIDPDYLELGSFLTLRKDYKLYE